MAKNHDIIEVEVEIIHQTETAIKVENLKGVNVWLPKSKIEIHDNGEISLPEWLAIDRELV